MGRGRGKITNGATCVAPFSFYNYQLSRVHEVSLWLRTLNNGVVYSSVINQSHSRASDGLAGSVWRCVWMQNRVQTVRVHWRLGQHNHAAAVLRGAEAHSRHEDRSAHIAVLPLVVAVLRRAPGIYPLLYAPTPFLSLRSIRSHSSSNGITSVPSRLPCFPWAVASRRLW